MTAIKSLLDEVRFEMLKVILLDAALDATLLFLLLFLLLSVFGMGLWLPLTIAFFFLIGDVWVRLRRIDLAYIEQRNPSLREMLRTAADNKENESLMAHALFAEVIEKMRRVSSGTFLDFKRIGFKIGTMFVLSMTLISLAFFNVNIQKFENPLEGVGDRLGNLVGGLGGGQFQSTENISDADDDLYGDPSIARLGDDQLDIQLRQNLNQIDFTDVSEANPSNDALDEYPVDVDAAASEAYTAGLADISDRQLAAKYSLEVKK